MSPHPATLADDALLAECELTTTRRSGPGGQHRNKVETAVVLVHAPTGTTAEASERRSQAANRQQALFRLRLRLAVEQRTAAGEPSELWQSRTSGGRISASASHADFPALVAEALNHLAECDFDTSCAGERLEVTATQLVNLLKKHRPAFDYLNNERARRERRPLN